MDKFIREPSFIVLDTKSDGILDYNSLKDGLFLSSIYSISLKNLYTIGPYFFPAMSILFLI